MTSPTKISHLGALPSISWGYQNNRTLHETFPQQKAHAAKTNVIDLKQRFNLNRGSGKIKTIGAHRDMSTDSTEQDNLVKSIDLDDSNTTPIKPIGLKKYLTPDSKGVLAGCKFLKLNPDEFQEKLSHKSKAMLLAWLSVIARLEGGGDAAHKILARSHLYDANYVTDQLDNALAISGPRTCENINDTWGGCDTCEFHCKSDITSPIKIRSTTDYIKGQANGFRHEIIDKMGNTRPGKIDYEALMNYFNLQHEFKTIAENSIVNIYKDNRWYEFELSRLRAFCQDNVRNPIAMDTQRKEFCSLMKCSNLASQSWFTDSTHGIINLQNGAFDVAQSKLLAHSPQFGFRYVLPYSYDKDALAPRFETFMDEITLGRFDIQKVLMEFIGYSLAHGPCFAEKALILYGDGANGKSTFMNVLKGLAGSDNYSSLSLTALNKDTKRYMLDGKLFNLGEETNVKALSDSDVFKTMVVGGEIDIKKLYEQDYSIENRCKLIMACNELPKSSDRSDGLYRRMILVPFEAKFTDKIKDPQIGAKLNAELPGIFNLAIEGYKRLIGNNYRFSHSESLTKALADYKVENDNILQWYKERLKWTDDIRDFIFKDQIYADYKEFCADTGNFAVNKISFFRSLFKMLPEVSQGQKMGFGGKRRRVVFKVELL